MEHLLTAFNPSWDSLYTNELSNNTADPSDTGTVWFDDADAERKVVAFLRSHDSLDPASASVLDMGCGNGSLLFALRDVDEDDEEEEDEDEEGDDGKENRRRIPWTGRMLGVDYSPQSVALAQQILQSTSSTTGSDNISFREWDVLAGPLSTVLNGAQTAGWDVVHDKGTFDAISLSSDKDPQGRRISEGYRGRVLALLRKGGYFVITSCNWTEPELKSWFESGSEEDKADEGEKGGFVLDGRVEYRTFSFGGVKGQPVTTLCFRKL